MRYVLSQFDYTSKDREVVGTCDPLIVRSATDVFEEEGGSDPEGFPVNPINKNFWLVLIQ